MTLIAPIETLTPGQAYVRRLLSKAESIVADNPERSDLIYAIAQALNAEHLEGYEQAMSAAQNATAKIYGARI